MSGEESGAAMAPVFSRPFDVILQEASSLPPASQLSTGLLRILRRALNASRKSLPKKTSSDGTIIRGFRQQATTGKLSFADGAWLDVFLVSRGTWMDHGLLSAFAASDEKEVYARVLRQHTGEEEGDLRGIDSGDEGEGQGGPPVTVLSDRAEDADAEDADAAIDVDLGGAGGVTITVTDNGSSAELPTATAVVRGEDDAAMAITTTGTTRPTTCTAPSTPPAKTPDRLHEEEEEMDEDEEQGAAAAAGVEGMGALLAAVRLQPVLELKRHCEEVAASSMAKRRAGLELLDRFMAEERETAAREAAARRSWMQDTLLRLDQCDRDAEASSWDQYYQARLQVGGPTTALGKRPRPSADSSPPRTSAPPSFPQAERVERLIGSDDYFRHQTAGLQPAAAAVGGEGITADGLAWAGASAAPPPPVLPTPRGSGGVRCFGGGSSSFSTFTSPITGPHSSRLKPLLGQLTIPNSSLWGEEGNNQQQQQAVVLVPGSMTMAPPPPRAPAETSVGDATTRTSEGGAPLHAGAPSPLLKGEALVEGLALGSFTGQLGPAGVDAAGSVACSQKDEDRVVLQALGLAAGDSSQRPERPQLLVAAVLDGHGSTGPCDLGRPGALASGFVAAHLMETMAGQLEECCRTKQGAPWEQEELEAMILYVCKETFGRLEQQLREHLQQGGVKSGGTTLAMAIITENKLFVANVGDSVVCLVKDGSLAWINTAHDCGNMEERKRVEQLGYLGWRGGSGMMVDGADEAASQQQPCVALPASQCPHQGREGLPKLAVTRSLGDFVFKRPVFRQRQRLSAVSPEPEMTVLPLEPGGDYLLLLCSDGALLGEPFGQEKRQTSVAKLVQRVLGEQEQQQQQAPATSKARALLEVARVVSQGTQQATRDDSSLVLLRFKGPAKAGAEPSA